MSLNVIIHDQQTTSESLNATVNNKFKYPRIYYWVFMDFLNPNQVGGGQKRLRATFPINYCRKAAINDYFNGL